MRPIVPEDIPNGGRRLAEQRRTLRRLLAATAMAQLHKTSIEEIVNRTWPTDSVTRAAATVATTGNTATLAFSVVGNALTGLAPHSAAARLFEHERIIKLDFKGVAQYAIPRGTLTPVPIFVAEAAPMPMSQLAMTSITIGPPRKILLGSGITNELEFSSGNNAGNVISTLIAEQAEKSLDAAVFDSAAADALRPAGLLNSVTPIAPTVGGGPSEHAMAQDLANMAQAISDAGISIEGLVIVAGATAGTKLKLLASPAFDSRIFVTTGVPGTTVVTIQPAALAIGFTGPPEISMSKDALVTFENASPQAIGTPGSPNAIAAGTRSAWQQDMLFLKVRLSGVWAVVTPGAVQVVNSVTW
jgi:hypothetical protein